MIGEETGITFGLVAIIGTAVAWLWWRMETRISKEQAKREALSSDLVDHKLHVERYFVSVQTLEKTEARLISAIEKLSSRMETLLSRMEYWGHHLNDEDKK